jgi:hypothetical protein
MTREKSFVIGELRGLLGGKMAGSLIYSKRLDSLK